MQQNIDITAGIAPGTLMSNQRVSQQRILSNNKKRSTMMSGLSIDDKSSRSRERSVGTAQQQMQVSSKPAFLNQSGSRLNIQQQYSASAKSRSPKKDIRQQQYMSEYKESRTRDGFIVRQMQPFFLQGASYVSNLNIGSVDEDVNSEISRISNSPGMRNRPPPYDDGIDSRDQSQMSDSPRQMLQGGKGNRQVQFEENYSPAQIRNKKKPQSANQQWGLVSNERGELQVLQDTNASRTIFNRVQDQGISSIFQQQGNPMYNINNNHMQNILQSRASGSMMDPRQSAIQSNRKLSSQAMRMRQADMKSKEEMNNLVKKCLKLSGDGAKEIDLYNFTKDCQKTNKSHHVINVWTKDDPQGKATPAKSKEDQKKQKREKKKMIQDFSNEVDSPKQPRNKANQSMSPSDVKETTLSQGNSSIRTTTRNVQNNTMSSQKEENNKLKAKRKQMRKAQQQIEYYNLKKYAENGHELSQQKYVDQRARKLAQIETNFISQNRTRFGHAHDCAKEDNSDDDVKAALRDDTDDFQIQVRKDQAKYIRETAQEREKKFLNRLQPVRERGNQEKIDLLFKTHQMENLHQLKFYYDQITKTLDLKSVSTPSDLERIKEKQESQMLYMEYYALIQHIDDLITMANINDTKEKGRSTGKTVSNDLLDKAQNGDLKLLLNQTSHMNAIISAGQFNMHKNDVKDRMSSLAFKMQKVYNLDKKRGPASEVYRYFMQTFDAALN